MTTFLLIRHGLHELSGKGLAGRQPGLGLNPEGQAQAKQLVERLAQPPVNAIHSSPRERTLETANPLAEAIGRPVCINPALDDIDFGGWTGREFAELQRDPQWAIWINTRTQAQPPDGETIAQVQRRITLELMALTATHPGQTVAVFTHCDIIKCALAHFLAISLDDLERFDIRPASISVVKVQGAWAQVARFNDTGPVLC